MHVTDFIMTVMHTVREKQVMVMDSKCYILANIPASLRQHDRYMDIQFAAEYLCGTLGVTRLVAALFHP